MPDINAANLRHFRTQKRWSLDQLAAKAGVDRGTIHRIETGKRRGCRQVTLAKLAEALDTDAETLTGPTMEPGSSFEASRKSQMNVRMSDDARNALNLVALRYKVKPTTIVHIAPLLFLWAAEESLKRRSARLDELEKLWDAMPTSSGFPHLNSAVVANGWGQQISWSERNSIRQRDLFGLTIPDDEVADDYEESEQNPMAKFMAELTADLGALAQFEYWSPTWDQPGYMLGWEEAADLVGGDEAAVHHIVSGNVGLHEIPKEVGGAGAEAIAAWVRKKGEAHLAEFEELLGEIRI